MGMPIVLDLRDEVEPGVLQAMWHELRRADAIFSTYKDDSEISRLNRGELTLEDADPDVREVLGRCEELRVITDGYFDAGRVREDGIDPSGLVKGWAVDRAGEVLDAAGVRNYSLNAGGDIRLRGAPLPGPRWRVGIQHPLQRDKIAAVVEGNDVAVATSGAYARGEHVVDPHTGRSPSGVLSVTVVGPDSRRPTRTRPRPSPWVRLGRSGRPALGLYEAMTILRRQPRALTPGFPSVNTG